MRHLKGKRGKKWEQICQNVAGNMYSNGDFENLKILRQIESRAEEGESEEEEEKKKKEKIRDRGVKRKEKGGEKRKREERKRKNR
jgi:hypothetical protein